MTGLKVIGLFVHACVVVPSADVVLSSADEANTVPPT